MNNTWISPGAGTAIAVSVFLRVTLPPAERISIPRGEATTNSASFIKGIEIDDSETVFNENLGRLTALASQDVLGALWDTPEEDEAWQHLQKGTS